MSNLDYTEQVVLALLRKEIAERTGTGTRCFVLKAPAVSISRIDWDHLKASLARYGNVQAQQVIGARCRQVTAHRIYLDAEPDLPSTAYEFEP
jgi:hypothetical protein